MNAAAANLTNRRADGMIAAKLIPRF